MPFYRLIIRNLPIHQRSNTFLRGFQTTFGMAQALPAHDEEQFTFFFRAPSPFSQWHRCKFTVDGVTYNCTEQYMMHQKAKLFRDEEVAAEIMTQQQPRDQKALGRKVKNFDEEVWTNKCQDIVKTGNIAKFTQNGKLKNALLATAGTTLAEASPRDLVWGIGLAAEDPLARCKENWLGQNLLGYILTEVRQHIMNTEGATGSRGKQKYTFFWRTESAFSQWHPADFTVDSITYNCAEQYMMHQKAVLFGDDDTAAKILRSKSPKSQKGLGRKVKNFDAGIWTAKCQEIVTSGNLAKFSQNDNLKEALLATAGTTIVEASPVDRIWGIGLAKDDPRALNKDQWLGQNLLGYILTDVREQLLGNK